MKKIILSVVAVLTFGFANAQEVKFGAKLGANLSTANVSMPAVDGAVVSVPDNKMQFGLHLGGFAEIKFGEKFAFQPELLFSMEGSKFESSTSGEGYSETSETKLKMSYINLPLLAKYYATEKLFFVAGPQLGILMSADQESDYSFTMDGVTESESTSADVKDQYKSINFSAAFGGGYFFTENIFAEARYIVGLSNVAESQSVDTGMGVFNYEPTAKLNTLQISVGYKF